MKSIQTNTVGRQLLKFSKDKTSQHEYITTTWLFYIVHLWSLALCDSGDWMIIELNQSKWLSKESFTLRNATFSIKFISFIGLYI